MNLSLTLSGDESLRAERYHVELTLSTELDRRYAQEQQDLAEALRTLHEQVQMQMHDIDQRSKILDREREALKARIASSTNLLRNAKEEAFRARGMTAADPDKYDFVVRPSGTICELRCNEDYPIGSLANLTNKG